MLNFIFTSAWIGGASYAAWYFSDQSILVTAVAAIIATLIRFAPRLGLDVLSEI